MQLPSRNDLKRIFLVDGKLGLIGVWRRIVNLGDMGRVDLIKLEILTV
jgi:hypothetical protein